MKGGDQKGGRREALQEVLQQGPCSQSQIKGFYPQLAYISAY